MSSEKSQDFNIASPTTGCSSLINVSRVSISLSKTGSDSAFTKIGEIPIECVKPASKALSESKPGTAFDKTALNAATSVLNFQVLRKYLSTTGLVA